MVVKARLAAHVESDINGVLAHNSFSNQFWADHIVELPFIRKRTTDALAALTGVTVYTSTPWQLGRAVPHRRQSDQSFHKYGDT